MCTNSRNHLLSIWKNICRNPVGNESVRSSFQPQHLPQQHLVNSVWNEDHPVGFCWDLYFSAQTKPLQNLQVFSVFVFIVMTLQCSWKVTLTLCLKEKNNKANQPTNQQKQQPQDIVCTHGIFGVYPKRSELTGIL